MQDDPKGSPKSAATQPDAPAQQGSVPPQGGAAGGAVGVSEKTMLAETMLATAVQVAVERWSLEATEAQIETLLRFQVATGYDCSVYLNRLYELRKEIQMSKNPQMNMVLEQGSSIVRSENMYLGKKSKDDNN